MTAAVAAGSAVAANMERGSVPSRTLLRGSTTELEDEEDVDDVLPFRFPFFVFDSVTWGGGHREGQGQGAPLPTFAGEHARMGFPSSMTGTHFCDKLARLRIPAAGEGGWEVRVRKEETGP